MTEHSEYRHLLKELGIFVFKLTAVVIWITLLVVGSLLFFGNIGKDTVKAGWGFVFLAIAIGSFIAWVLNRFVGTKVEAELTHPPTEETYKGNYGSSYNEPPPIFEFLKKHIAGQNEALVEIHNTIVKKIPHQKVISFLFVGPTGVGKTETAKALGEYFKRFNKFQFLRFDMGNFTEHHTASTLVGSPPGYKGFESGGALTRPLMKNPYAVLLFDEIEKAHNSLFRVFLSLIDEGEIQEISTGLRVPFRGIAIFTSNLYNRTIGEIAKLDLDPTMKELLIRDLFAGEYKEVLKYVPEEILGADIRNAGITQHFPPEFIGRIDKIIPFKPINRKDVYTIAVRALERAGYTDWKRHITKILDWVDEHYPLVEKYGIRWLVKRIVEEADEILSKK